jgi:hypothetical protein
MLLFHVNLFTEPLSNLAHYLTRLPYIVIISLDIVARKEYEDATTYFFRYI